MTPATAKTLVGSPIMDDVIAARELAERLGFDAYRSKAPMPAEFAGVQVLIEGFAEGMANARCEREQVRAGLL